MPREQRPLPAAAVARPARLVPVSDASARVRRLPRRAVPAVQATNHVLENSPTTQIIQRASDFG